MFSINKNTENQIIIKNSKFICKMYKVSTTDEVNYILESLRKEYKDATHVCFGYILENKRKYSDDSEPTGTAGAPIIDVLDKNELVNTLAVVIRYFGGIKLGAGGLIRAYSKAVTECLKLVEKEKIVFYNYYELNSKYDDLKLLNNLTKDLEIIKKDFSENIIYQIKVEKENDNTENIFKNTNIKIKKIKAN